LLRGKALAKSAKLRHPYGLKAGGWPMLRYGLLIGLLASGAALAQSAQGDISVTIYNNNLALVQDARTLTVPSGRSK
jgi:hypothetical protein